MNIGGYGQKLARAGLSGISHSGDLEAKWGLFKAELNRDEAAAQGEAAGLLTGATTRAAQGIYDERKAKHDKAWANSSDALTQSVAKPEYSALNDLQNYFQDWWD